MAAKRKANRASTTTESTEPHAAFTMQVLVRQTGIAADTLRAWERRYGFPVPARTGGGHRLYTPQDVEAVRWVLRKQQEGVRAKQAIELWQRQSSLPTAPPDHAPAFNHETLEVLRTAWLRACLALEDQAATQVFNSACAMLGPEGALLHVATAGLSQVGEQWAAGTASVAQEHFTSSLAVRHVESLLNSLPAATRPHKLLVTCPEGEIHEYPSLVLTYLLRRAGWNVIFLGANLPMRDLATTLAQEHPVAVLVCVQTVPALRGLLEDAPAAVVHDIPFAFGGSVFVRYPSLVARVPGFYLGSVLSEAPGVLLRILDGSVRPNHPAALESPWRSVRRALPDALLSAEAAARDKAEAQRLSRTAVEAELELLRSYLLSVVELGAEELVPGIWEWAAAMQKARGFDAPARAALLDGYRAALRRQFAHPGPLAAALEGPVA